MWSKRGNAMKIYYEVHGNGYPIILLHGNQENRKIYDQLIKDLRKRLSINRNGFTLSW